MSDKYRFRQKSADKQVDKIQKEIEDNFISFDENGDIVIDKDIRCRSLYVEGESLYVGGVKFLKPKSSEDEHIMIYDKSGKKVKFLQQSSLDPMVALNTHMVDTSTHGVSEVAENDHNVLNNYVADEHININNIICHNNQIVCNNNNVVTL